MASLLQNVSTRIAKRNAAIVVFKLVESFGGLHSAFYFVTSFQMFILFLKSTRHEHRGGPRKQTQMPESVGALANGAIKRSNHLGWFLTFPFPIIRVFLVASGLGFAMLEATVPIWFDFVLKVGFSFTVFEIIFRIPNRRFNILTRVSVKVSSLHTRSRCTDGHTRAV